MLEIALDIIFHTQKVKHHVNRVALNIKFAPHLRNKAGWHADELIRFLDLKVNDWDHGCINGGQKGMGRFIHPEGEKRYEQSETCSKPYLKSLIRALGCDLHKTCHSPCQDDHGRQESSPFKLLWESSIKKVAAGTSITYKALSWLIRAKCNCSF